MATETTPQTSPDGPIIEEAAVEVVLPPKEDVLTAGDRLKDLGDGWEGLKPDKDGRLHRPDGSFASKEEVEAGKVIPKEPEVEEPVAEEGAEPVEGEAPVEEAPVEGEEPVTEEKPKVVLKGHPERGEEDIELEVEDAAAAERIQRLQKEAMRRSVYEKYKAEVDAEKGEVEEFKMALKHNPIGTSLTVIPKQAQLDLAVALAAEHWDAIFPVLEAFSKDPANRFQRRLESRDAADKADQETRHVMEATRKSNEILGEVRKMVPEGAADEVRARFLADAERDLADAVNRGVALSPADVPRLLQDRIKMYGFGQMESAAPKKPVVAKRAGQPGSSNAPSVEEAKRKQAQLQNTVKAQQAAKALPPKGRGPVATRRPLVPAGSTVEAASDALAKATTWAEFRPT